MMVAERLVGGWQCVRDWEGNLGTGCISKPGLSRGGCCFVKGLGSPAWPIVDRGFQQQRTRGVRTSRRDRTVVKCVAQPINEEAVPEVQSQPTQYNDSWIEVKAVEFLTERIAYVCGKATDLKGYDGFVDITRKFVHGLPSSEQRDRVVELLRLVFPQWLIFCVRIVPNTKFIKEFYAKFTLVFFKWLVGECEVREGEIDGEMLKSTVFIKKCRYLEQSQCVGQCVNLCKNPTQTFIREQLGMPLTMKPNFEDMSCEMIYGLHPAPLEEDAAYQQPCYTSCQYASLDCWLDTQYYEQTLAALCFVENSLHTDSTISPVQVQQPRRSQIVPEAPNFDYGTNQSFLGEVRLETVEDSFRGR